MTRRVGLLGGECTGKSVLAAELETALPGVVVREALREFVASTGRTPRVDEQAGIMREQVTREAAACSEGGDAWVIGDPAPFMTAVYSIVYFDDDSLVDEAVEHLRGYDVVLWCDDDIPWTADAGMRDGPEYRRREQDVIRVLVNERLKPVGVHPVLVSGGQRKRLEQALLACASQSAER